jgi:hypothetical protein
MYLDKETGNDNHERIMVTKEQIRVQGKMVCFDAIVVDDIKIIVKGKYIKIAELREEWDHDVVSPGTIIKALKESGVRIDVFTFMQRLPDSRPVHAYFREWDSVAAISISTYDNWLKKQIPDQTRNKLKKAAKYGIELKKMVFGDELVRGISRLYNESPVRQGARNIHYNMEYDLVKKLNGTFLDRSDFYGAYYCNELIGYVKIAYTDKYARVMGIWGMICQQDKSVMNLLIAKAVEVCAAKNVSYFVYAKYDYGKKVGSDTLKEFKKNNGFENILLPRYFVPLNAYGIIALKLGFYKGIKNMLPRWLVQKLLKIRKIWSSISYANS